MKRVLLLVAILAVAGCASLSQSRSPVRGSRQLVLVIAQSWEAPRAELRRFERDGATAPWREVGGAVPVVLGRSGMAWGSGLHPAQGRGPQKREGDGKSPAGVFAIPSAFGFADTMATKAPYQQLTAMTECVDDVTSLYYNSIVQRDRVSEPDWESSEKMRSIEEYRIGLLVAHNQPPVRGDGSCIFMHVWRGESSSTAGCTAMDATPLEAIVAWLDPAAAPRLVQLPANEYARLKGSWKLP